MKPTAISGSGCRGALAMSAKRGITASQITTAIANEGAMGGINLTPEQIAAIAAAVL